MPLNVQDATDVIITHFLLHHTIEECDEKEVVELLAQEIRSKTDDKVISIAENILQEQANQETAWQLQQQAPTAVFLCAPFHPENFTIFSETFIKKYNFAIKCYTLINKILSFIIQNVPIEYEIVNADKFNAMIHMHQRIEKTCLTAENISQDHLNRLKQFTHDYEKTLRESLFPAIENALTMIHALSKSDREKLSILDRARYDTLHKVNEETGTETRVEKQEMLNQYLDELIRQLQ